MKTRLSLIITFLIAVPVLGQSFHRAEEDREITYWLLDPASGQFRISHDFTLDRPGQAFAHNFVRTGSTVADLNVVDLNTGKQLVTTITSGREVNKLGYYPEPEEEDSTVVQAALERPISPGETVRIRVMETYTDKTNYRLEGNTLVWVRTLGRPHNEVRLPKEWKLYSVNIPARIGLDEEGRVRLIFTNPRNDSLAVEIRAIRR